MTSQAPGHGPFDELAAGHALHALGPEDEQLFLSHAADCRQCQEALADFMEVAAALAETAPAAEPSPRLGERIMAVARGDLAAGGQEPADTGSTVSPLRRRAIPRWVRPATVAAAAALIGGGVWAGLSTTATPAQPSLATCVQDRTCSEVPLTASATHQQAAKVIVVKSSVYLVPASIPADDPARQIYVLWQITGPHSLRAIGSFDVHSGSHAPIKIGELPAPYGKTREFAISLERGRAIPPSPSPPVAAGLVPNQRAASRLPLPRRRGRARRPPRPSPAAARPAVRWTDHARRRKT